MISAPGYYHPGGGYPTWVPGMTFAPNKIPTPAQGRTYAAGMYPTWVPSLHTLQEAKRTRENFPETWVWETVFSGYVGLLYDGFCKGV